MKRELEKASLRESLALRRAEKAEKDKDFMEREHKQDMLQLRAQLEHLQQRFSTLAVRVQCMCMPTRTHRHTNQPAYLKGLTHFSVAVSFSPQE